MNQVGSGVWWSRNVGGSVRLALAAAWFTITASGWGAEPVETLWIEAEHLDGVQGYCWPMGPPEIKKTAGHWAFSGPGWAAEWNQGGESCFQSIACGADDDEAVATRKLEIPVAGAYQIWVRYSDWREKANRFRIRMEQPGQPAWEATYGEVPLFDEDNVMKLFWGWAFGWESHEAKLKKGEAKLSLLSTFQEEECRQLDVIVLTTDASYRPFIKERPKNYAWEVLKPLLPGFPAGLESLTRNRPKPEVPASWVPRTVGDKGFLYVQEVGRHWLDNIISNASDKVQVPYNLGENKDVIEEFEKKYAGKQDVPIFSDPRVTPRVYGPGPILFQTDSNDETVKRQSQAFVKWLDDHPDRYWATCLNYHGLNYKPVLYSKEAMENYIKYRDRFVGNVSGENLGYFETYVDTEATKQAGETARSRRELIQRLGEINLKANEERWRKLFGPYADKCGNLYEKVIPAGIGECWFPICYAWGAKAVGTEMVAVTGCMEGMFAALLRGAARQNGGMIFTYRSGNFGDGSATFEPGPYATTKQILDNYYSPYSGAGMTWWKFDGWYWYMAGSAMFQQESSRDNFWKPGGLTVAGVKEVQLSPRGKLDDRLLRLTAKYPDRGAPFTPVALLMDYAHGFQVGTYSPFIFGQHHDQWRFCYSDHYRNIKEYLWLAYYPIGPRSEQPISGLQESFVPGVFGDIFDAIYAYPDVKRWDIIDTYAAVIVTGDIELTAPEGNRLQQYIDQGGTVFVAAGQLKGPGAAAVKLPKLGEEAEADSYRWLGDGEAFPSQRYRFLPIAEGRVLAATPQGEAVCAAFDQGKGRLIFLSIPYGLGIDGQAVPIVARAFVHMTRGVMPVEVQGDVQWLVNKGKDSWLVTLINPYGQLKPQQGITPTDFTQNRTVTITASVPIHTARDRLIETDRFEVVDNKVTLVVPAGGVRIMELR